MSSANATHETSATRNANIAARAEICVLLLLGVAAALRVAVSGGMSPGALHAVCWIAGIAALVTLFLPGRRRWLDGWRLPLVALALWTLPSVYGRVGGDGVEYFVQARSFVFDRDLDFRNDYEALGATPIVTASGQVTSRMPAGTAVLWAPALALVHVAALVLNLFGANLVTSGGSEIYQSAATVTSFLLGLGALVVMEIALRARFGPPLSLLVILGTWLATPLYFYMVANPFMSHAASVFTAAMFLVSWLRARSEDDSSLGGWFIAGAWAGLMCWVRVQDAVLLLLPVLDVLLTRKPEWLKRLAALSAGPALCGLLQAGIWLAMYGPGFVPIVRSHGRLASESPQVLGLLLSPRHGLLTWTPLFVASIFGWLLLARRSKALALGAFTAFAAAVMMNSTNQDWWGSDSFGQRRMLGLLPLFAWGIAETMEALRRRPLVLLSAAMAALVAWNLQLGLIYNSMMVGTRNDALPLERVVNAQVELVYRRLLQWESWMPRGLWVVLYDNIKGVWLFEGANSLHGLVDLGEEPEGYFPLVGDGWFEPEMEGRTSFRRSRTRRSWLTVPLRHPQDVDFTIEVHARAELDEPERISVQLDINGTPVGDVTLQPGWTIYRFRTAEGVLHPGLNELTFVYSDTPRTLIEGFRGQNAVWSVDWVRFVTESHPNDGNP